MSKVFVTSERMLAVQRAHGAGLGVLWSENDMFKELSTGFLALTVAALLHDEWITAFLYFNITAMLRYWYWYKMRQYFAACAVYWAILALHPETEPKPGDYRAILP